MLQGIVLRLSTLLLVSITATVAPLAGAKGLKRASVQDMWPAHALELMTNGESRPAIHRAAMPQRMQVDPWNLRKNLADPIGNPVPLPDANDDEGETFKFPANAEFRQPTNGSTPAGWIQLGTPPKWLLTIFDTGSDKLVAKTWDTISTELATMDQGISGMILPSDQIYNHANSSSYSQKRLLDPVSGKQEPVQGEIDYGSGTAVTDEGNETVLVGGQLLENFPLSEITSDTLTILHTSKGVSGVLGLQHMKNRSLGSSLFSGMRDAGLMTSFGYCRGRNNTGTFIWNDQSNEGAEIPVVGDMHWAVSLGGLQVNGSTAQAPGSLIGKSGKVGRHGVQRTSQAGHGVSSLVEVGNVSAYSNGLHAEDINVKEDSTEVDIAKLAPHLCPDFKCTAILDTGSNIIAGPAEALKGLTDLISVKSDCSNFDQLPDLVMTLGSTPVVVKPAGYVMKVPMPKMPDGRLDAAGAAGADGDAVAINSSSTGSGERGDGGSGAASGSQVPESTPDQPRMHWEISDPVLSGRLEHEKDTHSAGLTQRAQRATLTSQEKWQAVVAHAAEEYGVDLTAALRNVLLDANLTDATELCMPALVPLDKMTKFGPLWVVGTPLLETTYVRWSWRRDQESPSINLMALSESKACNLEQSQTSPADSTGSTDQAPAAAAAAEAPPDHTTAQSTATEVPQAAAAPAAAAPAALAPAALAPAEPTVPLGLMRSEQRSLDTAAATASRLPLAPAEAVTFSTNVQKPTLPLMHGYPLNRPVERQIDEIRYPHWARNLLEV